MGNNNNGSGKGVRKGAWTSEEDILLRDCIHKFGEGKWHLVPLRAGLNRCRKSCRLRWLNYLRPNLKRGYFGKDEVDLIVRLHKLLGNRWSLIAGRLPGRTANDVKNFWNTHINSKNTASGSSRRSSTSTSTSAVARITHSNIVRPRPRTFSNLQPIKHDHTQLIIPSSYSTSPSPSPSPAPLKGNHNINPSSDLDDECIRWWGNLLHMTDTQQTDSTFPFPNHHPPITDSMFLQDHGIIPHQLCHTFSLPAHHSPLEHYLLTTD